MSTREVSVTLARANRVATLRQMSALIAHEINQPVAATVTNAQAALRFLEGAQPKLDEARQALAAPPCGAGPPGCNYSFSNT